jgi:hypothetical protein
MDVLNEKYLRRFQTAMTSDEIIHIVDSTEVSRRDVTKQQATNTWLFSADNVSDFAFAVSDHYLWDATSIAVDKESGLRVLIDAAYDKTSVDFFEVADIARNSIAYMSYEFPAVPFPYPQMTVFNGDDEMEYPMMVNEWSVYRQNLPVEVSRRNYSISLTAHEIFHSYFPFYMGINETKYAWMDEGWATFGDFLIGNEFIEGNTFIKTWWNEHFIAEGRYKEIAGSELDLPIIANSWLIKSPAYNVNSYAKAAFFYLILQDLLGADLFRKTVHEYMKRWNGKHPTPYDFFFTLNQASGKNLNWLIKPWFFEFGYPDLAIKDVTQQAGNYSIEIERIGNYPVPIHLNLSYQDETSQILHETAKVWRSGETTYSISGSSKKMIARIELGDVTIPDADLSNNSFRPESERN